MKAEELVQPASPTITPAGSLLTWLKVAIEWKRLILSMTIAIIVIAFVVALFMPKRYTATVVILPPQQAGSAGSAMMAQLSSLGAVASAAGGLGIKNPNDQQIALLKSRIVEDAMVTRFHLQDLYHCRYVSKARQRWEKLTKADSGLKDGLIRLSVTDRDPHRAAEMANAWVEEYRRFSATLAITEASQRRLFYERQLSAARDDLANAEEEMKRTEQRTGVIDIEGQGRSMIASAAVLRGQLAAKQIEIRGMREFAADGNPDLLRAEQEAAGIEGQLAAMDAANDRKSGDLIAPKGTVTQAALDYERALREVKYRETIQDLLMRQYEGARVDEARQGALVQIVEPAVEPDRPDSSYRLWILLAALVCSLPLALLAALAAEVIAIVRRARRRSGSWPAALEEVLEAWQ
ncbi:MAG: Wzz/FepE/Etk N-terminal domain-containing protein [Terracidiphilus sp.]